MGKSKLLLLMFLVVCWSCQNETELTPNQEPTKVESETPANEEEPTPSEYPGGNEYAGVIKVEDLYGVWKLVSVTITGDRRDGYLTIDYSAYSILYEFKTNGILTVSGVPENNERYCVHEIGDYPYAVGAFHDGRNLQIGDDYQVWWARFLPAKPVDGISIEYPVRLEFDTAPLCGPIYQLVKVE